MKKTTRILALVATFAISISTALAYDVYDTYNQGTTWDYSGPTWTPTTSTGSTGSTSTSGSTGTSSYEGAAPTTTRAAVTDYEWDPALDISKWTTYEIGDCSDGYRTELYVNDYQIYDAANGINLLYVVGYQSTKKTFFHATTAATVGKITSGVNGYACLKRVAADPVAAVSGSADPDNTSATNPDPDSSGAVDGIEYEWDPALDISSTSGASAETISCTEGYKTNIVISNGFVMDAANNENLYYQDPVTVSYNSSNRKLSYGSTGAVVGAMDDSTGTSGFICARIKEAAAASTGTTSTSDTSATDPTSDATDPTSDANTDQVPTLYSGYQAYSDVPTSEWFYDAVVKAQEKEWIKVSDKFNPNDDMTRCEFAKVLMSASGKSTDGSYNTDFADVPLSHWGYKYVAAGQAAGYWGGIGNGQFGCNSPVTREQAAKMIANVAELVSSDEDAYTPTDGYSDWALPYIRRMHAKAYMTGNGTSYNGTGNLKRSEAITVFYRIFGQ